MTAAGLFAVRRVGGGIRESGPAAPSRLGRAGRDLAALVMEDREVALADRAQRAGPPALAAPLDLSRGHDDFGDAVALLARERTP